MVLNGYIRRTEESRWSWRMLKWTSVGSVIDLKKRSISRGDREIKRSRGDVLKWTLMESRKRDRSQKRSISRDDNKGDREKN